MKYYILKKKKIFLLFTGSYGYEYEKIFKKEKAIEILKILGLINNSVNICYNIFIFNEF